ncbi:MAG: glycosyltransferase [Gammaproteobacteria bacterium]|nr:glycosyltransferase [Gammaproteobacteria bacterium]
MSSTEKRKILVISDHPLAPSGVGTQTKYVIEALLKTGRYKFVCLGGAVKHENYKTIRVDPWGADWIIAPVNGYGSPEVIRSLIHQERPDLLWFMTDPRFYGWLWDIENEVRSNVPMVYYHVWDNYPYPTYNKNFYESTDVIASISKVTHDIVSTVAPGVENHYIPHAVDTDSFYPFPDENIEAIKREHFGENDSKMTFFWNNRNARRKMSGSLLFWFNEFAEEVGPDKVRLILHTNPKDQHGQDLEAIIRALDADDGRIMLSTKKVSQKDLGAFYNISDCTVNISDAEGFGLSTLESLSCGTPIIVNMTGGLQEQVTDGEEWFGIGIEPASKAIIGSQTVPFIYEDRVSKEDFISSLKKMFYMTKEERKHLGLKGRNHVAKNYNFSDFNERWVSLIDSTIEKLGSWDSRKGYQSWEIKEVK